MNKLRKGSISRLNENDRKVIDKYTGFYTNFIESNTAESSIEKAEKAQTHR